MRGDVREAYDRHYPPQPEGKKALRLSTIISRSCRSLLAVALTAATLTGCGSSGSPKSGPDPASVVPASAPLYVSVVVRPTGSLEKDTVSVARKLTHLRDPFTSLLKAIQSESKSHVSWSEVKPWLGERLGLFITSLGGSGSSLSSLAKGSPANLAGKIDRQETEGALVLDVSDTAKARAFLNAQAGHSARRSSYNGVDYQIDPENDALAIVGHFAVIGSVSGLKAVIETSRGGSSLLRAAPYRKLSSLGRAGALANVYLSPAALFSSIRTHSKEDAQALRATRQLLRHQQQLYASLIPSSDSIAIDTQSISPEGDALTGGALAAKVLAGLPENSWLALGVDDLGQAAAQELKTLQSLASTVEAGGASPMAGLLGSLSAKGIGLQRDFLGWMGSAGLFVAGNGLFNLQLALVITSKNQAASRAAVGKIARLVQSSGGSASPASLPGTDAATAIKLKGVPFTLYAADGQGKFVVGLGAASVRQALSPSGTLGDSAAYRTAQAALGHGMQPSLILNFSTLVSFLDAAQLQNNESLGKIMPYLRSLNALTAGSERSGEVERGRIVLTLH